MGRNKFSQAEIEAIAKLLRRKLAGNRAQQRLVRHELRVMYEFNISDFNVQGQAFGDAELMQAIDRGAIHILDDATIAAMKEKRARDKARDAQQTEADAATPPAPAPETDWHEAMKQWDAWEAQQKSSGQY